MLLSVHEPIALVTLAGALANAAPEAAVEVQHTDGKAAKPLVRPW